MVMSGWALHVVELGLRHRADGLAADPAPVAVAGVQQVVGVGLVEQEDRLAQEELRLQGGVVPRAAEGQRVDNAAHAEELVTQAVAIGQGLATVAADGLAPGALEGGLQAL
jgi:hypothetical protein